MLPIYSNLLSKQIDISFKYDLTNYFVNMYLQPCTKGYFKDIVVVVSSNRSARTFWFNQIQHKTLKIQTTVHTG